MSKIFDSFLDKRRHYSGRYARETDTPMKKILLKIILQKFFVGASFGLMLLGVYLAYLEYSLFRIQVVKQNDPLIQYSFVDDKGAFVVSGGSDIEIKEVAWTIPSVAKNVLERINKHPRILTLQDLISQLYNDSTYVLSELSPHDIRYIVTCHILGSTSPVGIPLVAEVTFRKRGDTHLSTTSSLVYAEWLTSEEPFIDVYEKDPSLDEKERFVSDALLELRERFAIAAMASRDSHDSSLQEDDASFRSCFER